jgi:hypothetical protein
MAGLSPAVEKTYIKTIGLIYFSALYCVQYHRIVFPDGIYVMRDENHPWGKFIFHRKIGKSSDAVFGGNPVILGGQSAVIIFFEHDAGGDSRL